MQTAGSDSAQGTPGRRRSNTVQAVDRAALLLKAVGIREWWGKISQERFASIKIIVPCHPIL